MKKLISLLMAVAMIVAMAFTTVTAFAAPSPQTIPTTEKAAHNLTVNGVESSDIKYTPSSTNANEITFSYTGDGTLKNWETNLEALGLIEGVDYTISENYETGDLTITFLSDKAIEMWNNGTINVNAIVVFDEDDTEPSEKEDTTKAEESAKTTTKKPNKSPTSPATGAPSAITAGSVALLGAGIAVLAVAKKKDAE